MDHFFKVIDIEEAFLVYPKFPKVCLESIPLRQAYDRILAENIYSESNLPSFRKATMDGYAVCASSTFGATETNPVYLSIIGAVPMGVLPEYTVHSGEAVKIATGGMLPVGADSVVMVEYTNEIGSDMIEICQSVAPGRYVLEVGEDYREHQCILSQGTQLRAQEIGLLAAFGKASVNVYKQPIIGIVSTGDEIVPIDQEPPMGCIRDVNSYTLQALIQKAGCIPRMFGIVSDDVSALFRTCSDALSQTDMLLISGGSSVGSRDFTIQVLSTLPNTEILLHGLSISPGKPTILAKSGSISIWGLPGHVVSAMIVFEIAVRPLIETIKGSKTISYFSTQFGIQARLTRNIASAQGRTDFIRVHLHRQDGRVYAEPILGKSGLLHTMVEADGLIYISKNIEGLEKDVEVAVIPL
ncbi:MAG: molybdopterin molybdotransferase MoeA [Desulfobacterales bacterium]|nr:molybdopterin molybdotransferase MoeA [Desulfobacterales bacterium]